MLFDKQNLVEYEAQAPQRRFAKIFFDNQTFGEAPLSMACFRFEPGQMGARHKHEKEVEVYYCLKGKGRVTVDGKEYILSPNTALYIAPQSFHETKNIGDEEFEFLAIFAPCVSLDFVRNWGPAAEL